jgi:hypothetical protein
VEAVELKKMWVGGRVDVRIRVDMGWAFKIM